MSLSLFLGVVCVDVKGLKVDTSVSKIASWGRIGLSDEVPVEAGAKGWASIVDG